MLSKFFFTLPALVAALVSPSTFNWTTTTVKTLAPGVLLTQKMQTAPPLIVNILTVDPSIAGNVRPAVANDSLTNNSGNIHKGRENVSALAARKDVLAAVNGDYFPFTGDPLGLGIMNGEIYSEPYVAANVPGRAAIGWLPSGRVIVGIPKLDASISAKDGAVYPVTGIDRMTATDNPSDLVVYTSRYGPTSGARGGGVEVVLGEAQPMPLDVGSTITGTVRAIVSGSPDPVNIPADGLVISVPAGSPLAASIPNHFHLGEQARLAVNLRDITPDSIGSPAHPWNSVRNAIGGGPILLRGGQVIVDDTTENLGGAFSDAPHARTAVGQRADGTTLIVTVDSGSALSGGISLRDLSALLQQEGVVDAINLDGGGSTTMVAKGVTVDYPYGSSAERPVADMLTIANVPAIVQTATIPQDTPAFAPLPADLQIGQSYPLRILAGNESAPVEPQNVIWNGPVGSVGFVSQDGVLHVLKAGHGTITAKLGTVAVSMTVDVAAAPLQPAQPPVTTPAHPDSSDPEASQQ